MHPHLSHMELAAKLVSRGLVAFLLVVPILFGGACLPTAQRPPESNDDVARAAVVAFADGIDNNDLTSIATGPCTGEISDDIKDVLNDLGPDARHQFADMLRISSYRPRESTPNRAIFVFTIPADHVTEEYRIVVNVADGASCVEEIR